MNNDAVPQFDRRAFLASVVTAGGALVLGFDFLSGGQSATAAEADHAITAWIVIKPDDTVIIRIAKSEMGQGSSTGLAMLVAEELECDWDNVTTEFINPHDNFAKGRPWGDMSTGGSRSIGSSHEFLRKAGATAREMLISAAAAQWDVPARECRAAKGVVTHMPSERRLYYGALAEAAAKMDAPTSVELKDPKDWTLIGQPTKRLAAIEKVEGRTIYGIDVRVPNMLYAALMQCPVFKGTLKSVGDAGIRKGVRKVIKLKYAVAVVADTWWRAKTALEALEIDWDAGANGAVSSQSIDEFIATGLAAKEAGVGRQQGDIADGLARAVQRIEADYSAPFLAHATLEPQNCTAHVSGDRCEIWVPTQNGEAALATAARAAGVPIRNTVVHTTMLGGGFGRRGITQDFIPHAVMIAKEMGQPVKTIWSREEDMRHDYYRPAAMCRMMAGLGQDGRPYAWHVRLSGNSILGTLTPFAVRNGIDPQFQEGFVDDMPYDVADYLADYAMRNTHVPVGFWRCVNHTQNCFFRESFIDELAHAAHADPYEYRRRLLGKHRNAAKFLRVLEAAANAARWGTPLPRGVSRGIAMEEAYGTYVAGVAEASIGPDGSARLHRIVIALDPGIVVNPLSMRHQAESAVVYGLTAALYGEITIRNGRVEQSNFDDYRMLRMAEMPQVETVLVPSGDFWSGCGEPPVAVIAPALCNAIFAATGRRIRSLPLKNQDLRRS